MSHPQSTAAATTPANAAPGNMTLRSTLVLGLLAALFAFGVALLYTLTRDESGLSPAQQPTAKSAIPTAPNTETDAAPQAMPAAGNHAADAARLDALQMEVAALEAELAGTRRRIDSLSASAAGFADASARIEALEAQVAAARRAADAAAAQAAQAADVARRFGRLTADYAELGARFTADGVLIRLDETALAFAPGTTELPAAAREALTDIAAFLQRHRSQQVRLRGHTDATGSDASNIALSEARAAAVRDALITLGVAADRLKIEGAGAAEPIADNASAEGRRRNRRVDILLASPAQTAG